MRYLKRTLIRARRKASSTLHNFFYLSCDFRCSKVQIPSLWDALTSPVTFLCFSETRYWSRRDFYPCLRAPPTFSLEVVLQCFHGSLTNRFQSCLRLMPPIVRLSGGTGGFRLRRALETTVSVKDRDSYDCGSNLSFTKFCRLFDGA